MTNTKDKYSELRERGIRVIHPDVTCLGLTTISADDALKLLADLDAANQLLQKVVDDTEIGCVPRSHLNRIEAYLSNPPTDKEQG